MLRVWRDRFSSKEHKEDAMNVTQRSKAIRRILSSQCFEGFVENKLRHLDIQGGLILHPNHDFDRSILRPRLIRKSTAAGSNTHACVQYLNFLPCGKRLLCLEVKASLCTDGQTWRNSLPLSQIIVYRCGMGLGHLFPYGTSYDCENVSPNMFEELTCPLEYLLIFCADLSNNGEFLAICGANKNNKRHMITVHKISVVNEGNRGTSGGKYPENTVTVEEIALFDLGKPGFLSAKFTSCKISPDATILVTTFCNDFFTGSLQNQIDFWNFKARVHVGRLDPSVPCTKRTRTPRGYISSTSFCPAGNVIIFCTSALQILLYSISNSAFSDQIYNIKTPPEFVEEKWQPVFSSWTPTFGPYEFVVCSQDGTLTRYGLKPEAVSLNMRSQTNIFKDTFEPTSFVYGIEFCPALLKLFITISHNEIITYSLATNTIEERFVSSAVSVRNTQRLLAGSINSSTAISRHGEEIATAVGDTINLFLLPHRSFSLKSICREAIANLVPENCIIDLPLPKCLVSYLLYDKYSFSQF